MAQTEPIEIPIKLGVAEMRNQLKQAKSDIIENLNLLDEEIKLAGKLKDALSKTDNIAEQKELNALIKEREENIGFLTQRNAELSQQAGQVRDRMVQVNEQVAVFASGSSFEQAGKSLGLIGSQLGSLDFEGAGESALLLQQQINSITPEEVNKQIQGLQTTFTTLGKVAGTTIIGLAKNIGQISSAFASFGKALLMNPIFLMAAAFAAIVGVIALLLDKLGFLQPILDGIGAVFEWIGDVIDTVVQAIKDFLDWLGITDYAAQDSAVKHTKAMEKKADAYEKTSEKIQFYLDEEIKLTRIAGKDTTKLEIEKQRSIRETAKVRLEALQAKIAENKLTKELDEEELKALNEKIAAQRQLIRGATSEIKIIKAQEAADKKKEADEDKKEAQARAKEAEGRAKEANAKAKQYAQNRFQAERQIRDLELQSITDAYTKEVELNKEKYKRLIEDTKLSTTLTNEEKKRINQAYEQEEIRESERIFKAKQAIDKQNNDALILALEQSKQARLDAIRQTAIDEQQLKILLMESDQERELAQIEFNRQRELEDLTLTETEKAIINEQFRQEKEQKEQEYRDRKKELERQMETEILNTATTFANSIGALSDLVFEIKKSKLKAGSAAEEAAAKKNFETNKKVQIAVAVISGIQGVINAMTAQSVIPEPFGTILKAVNAVAIGISTAANIAKIRNTKYGSSGGGGGASTPSGGGGGNVTPAMPTTNLFGNSNNLNNLTGTKPVEGNKEIVVKAVVAQDEMTASQMVDNKIIGNSKL